MPQESVTVRVAVPVQGLASGQVNVTVPVPPGPSFVAGEAADPSAFANDQLYAIVPVPVAERVSEKLAVN